MTPRLAEQFRRELLAEVVAATDEEGIPRKDHRRLVDATAIGTTHDEDLEERSRRAEEYRRRLDQGERLFDDENQGTPAGVAGPHIKGDEEAEDQTMEDKCAVPGCTKPAKTRGVCTSHYVKRGDPEVAKHLAASKTTGARTHPSGPKPVRRKRQPWEEAAAPIAAEPEDGKITVRVSVESAEAMVATAREAAMSACASLAGTTDQERREERFQAMTKTVLDYLFLRNQVNAAKTAQSQQL